MVFNFHVNESESMAHRALNPGIRDWPDAEFWD